MPLKECFGQLANMTIRFNNSTKMYCLRKDDKKTQRMRPMQLVQQVHVRKVQRDVRRIDPVDRQHRSYGLSAETWINVYAIFAPGYFEAPPALENSAKDIDRKRK